MARTLQRGAALVIAACALSGTSAVARVLLTVEEALSLAFPGARIERHTIFLTPRQIERAAELAGEEPLSAIVHPYVATRDGVEVGTAYFDSHVVRTLAETIMVTVDPDGRVGRVEVLSFDEPPDYLPRAEWYEQFSGRRLDAELELRRAIRPVAGATLTARVTTDAARRILALHQALTESSPAGGARRVEERRR
jgi:Na+-translocating ferredoxin:NAD+ oxidoreductase RnfG subunit